MRGIRQRKVDGKTNIVAMTNTRCSELNANVKRAGGSIHICAITEINNFIGFDLGVGDQLLRVADL